MGRLGITITGLAALAVGAPLLSFQAPPRTATFAEVLKGLVGRECSMGGGDGFQLLVFPPGPVHQPEKVVWPRLTMVGEDFVRVTHEDREVWMHMSRIAIQTKPK